MPDIKEFPEVFIPVFVAIDVFALLPFFISYTRGLPPDAVRRVINQSIMTALGVSIGFVAIGEGIFRILGITVDDFKVAGGLVLLVIAVLELVKEEGRHRKKSVTTTIGVVPLGVPMIVGPALLTTLLVLVDHYGVIITLFSLLLNLFIVWLLCKNATRVVRIIGKEGVLAISKLMAILLASIAVMMIRLGLQGLLGLQ